MENIHQSRWTKPQVQSSAQWKIRQDKFKTKSRKTSTTQFKMNHWQRKSDKEVEQIKANYFRNSVLTFQFLFGSNIRWACDMTLFALRFESKKEGDQYCFSFFFHFILLSLARSSLSPFPFPLFRLLLFLFLLFCWFYRMVICILSWIPCFHQVMMQIIHS